MYTKLVKLLKLIVSAYFVFIGVELIKIMMDQRPEDLTKKLLTAAFFMIAGAGYFLWTLMHVSGDVRTKIKEVRANRREETGREAVRENAGQSRAASRRKAPGRDGALLRTAPMGPAGETVRGTAPLKKIVNIDLREDLSEEFASEQVVPGSWDEKTRAMWMEDGGEEDSLKRYWDNDGLELELEAPPELQKETQRLPVITQDTEEILSMNGATRAIPDISEKD